MKKRLLVIDSEPFNQEIARKIFSGKYEMGFENSANGLEHGCQIMMPNVILFEKRTPETNDLRDLLIKARLHNPSLPVVVIISNNSLELETVARSCGAFYCMIRPFNLKELWDILAAAFSYADVHCPYLPPVVYANSIVKGNIVL